MENIKLTVYAFLSKVRHIMPGKIQEIFNDWFFLYLPIWFIRKLTIEYDGYFKHYQPRKGDTVFDCGAWIGHFTLMASRLVGKNGIVYSFEPQEEIFNVLKKRIKRRNIKNVIPIHCALYSHKSTMSVEKETSSADFSIVDIKNGKLSNPVTINLIDLDSFVKEFKITRLNFIKMDIEGAEIDALKGAKNVLKNLSPNIAIASYHMREGAQTAKWLEHFLNEQGYKTWTGFPLHLTTYGYK